MNKIHHIGYAVKDIPSSINIFFKLGYKKVSKIVIDESRNISIQFLENGPYLIELIAPLNSTSPISNILKKTGPSPYHFCYEVDNIQEEILRFSKEGFIILGEKSKACAINEREIIFLYDKNIGLIELIQKN